MYSCLIKKINYFFINLYLGFKKTGPFLFDNLFRKHKKMTFIVLRLIAKKTTNKLDNKAVELLEEIIRNVNENYNPTSLKDNMELCRKVSINKTKYKDIDLNFDVKTNEFDLDMMGINLRYNPKNGAVKIDNLLKFIF